MSQKETSSRKKKISLSKRNFVLKTKIRLSKETLSLKKKLYLPKRQFVSQKETSSSNRKLVSQMENSSLKKKYHHRKRKFVSQERKVYIIRSLKYNLSIKSQLIITGHLNFAVFTRLNKILLVNNTCILISFAIQCFM